jgi:biotin transporter BioY
MTIAALIQSFIHDQQTKAILLAIIVDLVLGVAAAFKLGTFRLTYLSNFARNDLLGKVVPFLFIHSASEVAGGTNIVIPGLDLSALSTAMFALVMAAMVGSILSSIKDLGFSAIPAQAGSGR